VTSASRGDVEERLEAATARANFSGYNLWRKSPDDSMSGCARERERKGGQKEGARVVICTEFDSDRRQYPRLR
jgi:hypothetical protein